MPRNRSHWLSRSEAHLYEPRRAAELNNEDGDAATHPAHEPILKEGRLSLLGDRVALDTL